MKRDDVLRILAEHWGEFDRFAVKRLALFGSVARDEAGPDSDVDVLVEFDGPATFNRYMDLRICLEDLLGARIDLVTRRALRDRLRPRIEQEAIDVS